MRRRGERYQIIAGERRWRAAQALGLASVPVTLRDVADEQLLELALVENVQREDLTPLEEAQAFQRMQSELGLTQEEIARRVGRDRTTVANTLRLLRLPRELRELVGRGALDAGHARALLALEAAEDQLALGREAARRGSRCARSKGAWRSCARRAAEGRRAQGPEHRARPRSGCAARSAPASRSAAAARAAPSACTSRARRSCSACSSCCSARGARDSVLV